MFPHVTETPSNGARGNISNKNPAENFNQQYNQQFYYPEYNQYYSQMGNRSSLNKDPKNAGNHDPNFCNYGLNQYYQQYTDFYRYNDLQKVDNQRFYPQYYQTQMDPQYNYYGQYPYYGQYVDQQNNPNEYPVQINEETKSEDSSKKEQENEDKDESLVKLHSSFSLCTACTEIVQKHFGRKATKEELRQLLSVSSKEAPSTKKLDGKSEQEEPVKPRNVTPSSSHSVRDSNSAIYEGHPTKLETESVQSLVEDHCSRCGGWTLVRQEPSEPSVPSVNLP